MSCCCCITGGAATGTPVKPANCVQGCCLSLCCLRLQARSDVQNWMLTSEPGPSPSIVKRLCFCHCTTHPRKETGIATNPALAGLGGVTLQSGEVTTAGSLQTLKWGAYDADKRVANIKVFGGWSSCNSYGDNFNMWTENPSSCPWYCLVNVARLVNYSYVFKFEEDFMRAEIGTWVNPCGLCCCTCLPAWAPLMCPCFCGFDMIQAGEKKDGTNWTRRSNCCGGKWSKMYDLVTVFNADGTPGPHYDKLNQAPESLMLPA